MTNNWIIDVLADLTTFATKNGLTALADQLEDTTLVAMSEVSSLEGTAQSLANWEVGSTGRIHRTTAAR